METAVKLIWVSEKEPAQRTAWLVASGLRPEIEFERYILAGIESKGGEKTALETRMLDSIQNNFDAAEISRADVENSKRLPDLSSMFEDIGWSRLQYVILQRLGSHAVHGNWPSLLADYLEETDIDGYDLMPRGRPVNLHPNVYMTGARLVLSAVAAYSRHCLKGSAAEDFEGLAEEAYEKLMQDYKRAVEFGL